MTRGTKDWLFTDFDVSNERVNFYKECEAWNFITFQEESCPESGKLHLQGFFQLKIRKRLSTIKKIVGQAVHLEMRRGSVKDAINYCNKSESSTGRLRVTIGEPTGQGKRKDLDEIKVMIDSGASIKEVADTHFPTWVRNYRALDRYKRMKIEEVGHRDWKMENTVFYGAAGTGKTRRVYEECKEEVANNDLYPHIGGKWFDGYEGQSVVLFDDFTGGMELGLFLKVLDRYPLTVEVKGGSCRFLAKKIFITSNLSPEEWYPMATKEQHAAIRRRIDKIVHFN